MNRILLPVLLPVFLAAVVLACKNASKQENNTGQTEASEKPSDGSRRKTILFFGNSLTAAYQLPREKGFPDLIQKRIDSLGYNYQCINAGVSGETTMDGLTRINWMLSQPVDIFVLELGANDALRGLPLKDTKRNLEQIVQMVKAKYPTCIVVVAGMQAPPNLGAEYTTTFLDLYSTVAAKHNAKLIPFLLEGVAADPSLNLEDGIHPNEKGHKIVAENVWKVIQPLLMK